MQHALTSLVQFCRQLPGGVQQFHNPQARRSRLGIMMVDTNPSDTHEANPICLVASAVLALNILNPRRRHGRGVVKLCQLHVGRPQCQ